MRDQNTRIKRASRIPRPALIVGVALAAALTLGGCAAGESGSDATAGASHGAGHETGASSGDSDGTSQASEANDADVMFAQMMLPHHEQAIEMSDILLAQEGLDPEIAALAEQIKAAQGPEIETLEGWLEDWGADGDSEGGGSMGHEGMDGMLSTEDLEAMEQADTEEATRLYLEGMIEHHRGAVEMAEAEVAEGQDPRAIEMAQAIIASQNAEMETMQHLLGEDPTAAGPAGAPESGPPVAGDQRMLADHGLEGLGAREIIERLDAQAVAERPADLVASVQPEQLVVADDAGRQTALPMPEDEVYLSAAPYESQTHECHFHSLTTCLGELQNQEVQVTLADRATGEVLVDQELRTFDNGFVGMWVPKGIEAELTIEHAGKVATAVVSTRNADDPTCLTGLRLKEA